MSMLPVGFGASGDYTIEESLRFNASQSSYLSWTPASAGNRKTWTWSGWVKKANSGIGTFISADPNSGNRATSFYTRSLTDGRLEFEYFDGATTYNLTAVDLLRDPSSFYHLVLVVDTTQATNTNRIKIYKNGVQLTLSGTYVPQNTDMDINNTVRHNLGRFQNGGGATSYFDGYMTEVNFIDGQALDASSFGETDATTGVWKPKEYTGTYGTNGFYLPMKLDNTVEGFNTVTFIGTGAANTKISGVGFSPDLVWLKPRSKVDYHQVFDTVRGVSKNLSTDQTAAEQSQSGVTSFDTDGFTLGSWNNVNGAGDSVVAWCWDAGSSTVSNTDGSITSTVRANPTYGFSVVSYTGTGANATVGHGLGTAPSMVILKNRSVTGSWMTYHSSIGNTGALFLNLTNATITSSTYFNNTSPTSTVFSLGDASAGNGSGNNIIAYCFSEVSGYSKFGSYTGTGAAGNVVTTGFKPAFVMIKCSNRADDWVMFDTTRGTVNGGSKWLLANTSGAETGPYVTPDVTDTGFILQNGSGAINNTGDTYIYMAFKDTREYAFWLDDSGNNNDWQPNGGITTSSTVTDTPTPYLGGGNYATWNPLVYSPSAPVTFSNGNLDISFGSSLVGWGQSTIGVSSGKWYSEIKVTSASGTDRIIGVVTPNTNTQPGYTADSYGYYGNGQKITNNSLSAYGASYTTGDVIGIALDLDVGTLTFYKNNVSQGTAFTGLSGTFLISVSDSSNVGTCSYNANFGQRPFAYTPPTGFLPLHTGNLPDSSIVDGSKYFDAVTRTGTGAEAIVSGLQFQPDLLWTKTRSNAVNHSLTSTGLTYNYSFLQTNTTAAENTSAPQYYMIPTSDGYTVGTGDNINQNTYTFVDWVWKAGGAGVSNTDGSITSTVSANPTAGFSIVSWTSNGNGSATVGHGLGVAPKVVIYKDRTAASDWYFFTTILGSSSDFLRLNTTDAKGTSSNSITSTTFNNWFGNTNNLIAYCFAEVEGYSKFGSYTGNGSADGPFVYCGFKPAFVMIKTYTSNGANTVYTSWTMYDNKRPTGSTTTDSYNTLYSPLYANRVYAEGTRGNGDGGGNILYFDLLSNGFKVRNNGTEINNATIESYIYMAFAENPFKNALAR